MRNLGLDILRFVAVLLVLGRHLHLPDDPHQLPAFIWSFLSVWKLGGWVGVDLFFVLSGFLVSGLLFREYINKGKVDVVRFLIRRAFKIYPPFYLFLFVTIIQAAINNKMISARSLLGELLFFQNYLGGLWNHTWSLAVEEHFYLLLALLVFMLTGSGTGKGSLRAIPVLFTIVAIGCLAGRLATGAWIDGEAAFAARLFPSHLRIDSLFFGVLLSYGWHCGKLRRWVERVPPLVLVLVGVVALAPAFIYDLEKIVWVTTWGLTLFYIGSGAFVLGAVAMESSRLAFLKMIGLLGAASYSVYLWHMTVNFQVPKVTRLLLGGEYFVVNALLYLIGSFVVGYFLSQWIEQPSLALRDRLFPDLQKNPLKRPASS